MKLSKLSLVIELRLFIAEWFLGRAMFIAPYPEGKEIVELVLSYLQKQPPNAPPLPSVAERAAWIKR